MGPNGETASADPLIGNLLADRYRLDELLGEGGMGRVYAAEHVLMRKAVAVKILHRNLCELPEIVARFEREAMATSNIEHPNIAAATDAGKLPDGSLFLVLELVRGKSLRDEIGLGAMPVERALHIARQIASALAAAHALGVIHRDLKPENVMLVGQGSDPDFVKVLDFGVAKIPPTGAALPGGPLTKLGVVFGTPEYMPPEQALGQPVDGRADLYALGVITYELVSGVRPFAASSEAGILGQQLAKPPPPFSERAPGVQVPVRVEQLVHKLLAKETAARFQTADEVVRAVDELLQPSPNADGRIFTQPDGSPTAFLGTAAALYGEAQPQIPSLVTSGAEPPPAADPSAEPRPPPAPRAPKRAAASVGRAFDAATAFVDAQRPKLPPSLRQPLAKVPSAAVVGGALLAVGATLLVVLALLVWLIARPARPIAGAAGAGSASASAAPAPDPVLAELEGAKREGHAALEKLAERHPKHPRVHFELALSHASRSDHSAAVAALGRALAEDRSLGSDPAATLLLTNAARERPSSDAALDLLEGPMGAAGAGVLYDLSIDDKLRAPARARAQKWVVQSPEFLKVAPPNVEVAAKLRYGKSCTVRKDLLPRAGEVGDRRALAYLKIMKVRGGCGRRGRDDCFSCLRKDDALEQAIAAIEKRLGAAPK